MKALLVLAAMLLAFPVYAEDWKTSDGKTYQNVKVVKVEDDAVTIMFKEGGARIALSTLPANLQQKFSYDPDKAKAASAARAKADAENAKVLQAEIVQAEKIKKAQQIRDAQQQQGITNSTASTH